MQCTNDEDPESSSDFFGLNSYSWCGGDATFQSAGYNTLVDMFKDSAIPVFFSEYGCNKVMPRVFDEVAALYSSQMTALSGGLVYEYSQVSPQHFFTPCDDYYLFNPEIFYEDKTQQQLNFFMSNSSIQFQEHCNSHIC
jgi:hypothetical protein